VAGLTSTAPSPPEAARVRHVVVAVGLVALLFAAVHGAVQRPWAYEDEQQHVDLALKLADGRVAHIEDLIEPSLVRSTLDTRRPSRAPDFANDDPATWGLEGRSYMGYHPPLAQALLAPLSALTGRDAEETMRAGRALAALLVGLTTMLVAALAACWCPRRRAVAAAMAGLAFGTLPVVSDLGGRWSNDVVALALAVAACFVATRVAVAPTNRDLVLLAVLMAGAVSAKATGAAGVGAALCVAGPAIVRRRGWAMLGATFAVPALAALAWVAATQVRYGTLDGSAAFRDTYGVFHDSTSFASSPFDAHGGARLLLHNGLLPQLNADWGLTDWVPLAVAVLLLAGVVGVALRRQVQPLAALAGIAIPSLILLEVVMRNGQIAPTGRFLVPVIAIASAVAAATWSRWRVAGWAPSVLCSCLGIWFVVEHRVPW
jgi:hypothetical protein